MYYFILQQTMKWAKKVKKKKRKEKKIRAYGIINGFGL